MHKAVSEKVGVMQPKLLTWGVLVYSKLGPFK